MRGRALARTMAAMTPEDVAAVQRSWAELRDLRPEFDGALARRFEAAGPPPDAACAPVPAGHRAAWMLRATSELVGLLAAPSRLADRARALGETWPDPCVAPSFDVEGRAWLAAAAETHPAWSPAVETAWRQAWLLLSDVLAAEALSPFGAPQRTPQQTETPKQTDDTRGTQQ